MKDETKIIFYSFLVLVFGVLFTAVILNQAQNASVDLNSAQNAVVAKNLALQGKYASSYHEFRHFDETASTGPTQVIPLAVAVAVSGNSYAKPLEVSALLNGLLLLLCIFLLVKGFEDKGAWLIFSFVTSAFFLIFENSQWFTFTAELPVVLLCFLSASLFIYDNNVTKLLAGLFCGFAVLLSPLAVLFFVSALLYLVIFNRNVKSIIQFLTGIALPVFIWQSYKLAVTGASAVELDGYHYLLSENALVLAAHFNGSAVENIQSSLQLSHQVLVKVFAQYGLHYVFYVALLLFTALSTFFSVVAIKKGHESFSAVLSFSLFSCLLWVWYFVFNSSTTEQFIIYPVFSSVISVGWFCLATKSKVNFVPIIFLALLIFMLPESRLAHAGNLLKMKAEKSSYKSSLIEAKTYIETNSFKDPLASCGENTAPWMMEYLLKSSLNFQDCYKAIENSSEKYESFVLFKDKPLWRSQSGESDKNQLLTTYCKEADPLFDNVYYSLMSCKVDVRRFKQGRAAAQEKQAARITPGVSSGPEKTDSKSLKDSSGKEVQTRSKRKIGKAAADT